MTNTWIQFMKSFYKTERSKDSSKCHNRVNLKQVARVYNCKKKAANKTVNKNSYFRGMNPMHKTLKKHHVRTMRKSSSKKKNGPIFLETNPMRN